MSEIGASSTATDREPDGSRSVVLPRQNVVLRVLDHLEEWLIAILIAAATGLIFIAVVHRYGTGLSIDISKWAAARGIPVLPQLFKSIYLWFASLDLSWAQELCIYMFIWMAKFGAAYGVRTGIHVGVDLLVNRLPEQSRKQVILFALLCGALFTGMIAAFGVSFVGEMFKTGQQSNDLEAPMWFIYLAIPLGSGLMCFRFLQVSWAYYLDRPAAASRRGPCRGCRGGCLARAASAARGHGDAGAGAQGQSARRDPDHGADPDLQRSALPRRPASSCCRRRCAPPPSSRC